MKTSKGKGKKTHALKKAQRIGKDIEKLVDASDGNGKEMSLIERVNRESVEVSTAKGRKREIARMAFALWLTIPTRYLGAPEAIVKTLGISEPDVLELIQIKTVREFGEKCNVSHQAMADWRKEIVEGEEGEDVRRVFRGLMKEGLGALYQGLLEHKDAERFKTFAGFVQGWMPGINLIHSGSIDNLDDEKKAALDKFIEKNKVKV